MKQHSWNALRTAGALLIGILAAGCSGSAGRGSDADAAQLMPTVTITANPTTVMSGTTSALTWSTSNATACTASGSWSGTRSISGTEITAPISAGSAYTLTCSGAGGMAAATANVAVAPTPTVTITASPTTVASGGSTTLMWSTTAATSCIASGSWSGTRPTMGSEVITVLTASSAFTLTCTGPGGDGAATVNVAVMAAPTVTLTADPSTVMSGGNTTLSWSSTNTSATNSACTASGGWSGARGPSGTETITGLTTATSFTLSCSGLGGTAAASANIAIAQAAAPPVVILTANPASVASGAATTLTWSTTDATACTASGAWSGSRATSGTQLQATINMATAYTLTCTGPSGTGAATANVVIAPRPTVTITATPGMVASGGSVTLNWSSTNSTSCIASGGWTGARATSGMEMQAPITTATVYTLTCTGPGGMGAASANVAIVPAPTVTIAATPTSVVSGGASTLTWASNNATSCAATGSWSGPRGTSGSEMITNITMASAFTLTCTGLGGMGAATANVAITAPSAQPTVSITANPLTVSSGGSTTLMWATTNATACTASGSWTGSKPTMGSEVRTNLTANASFTLTCTGAGGTGSGTVNVSVAQAAGSYSTNFNLTETPISETGVWRRAGNTFTNVRTINGTAFGTNGPADAFDDSYALLRGFGANYTAQAVVRRSDSLNVSVTHEVELLLRFTDDATTARGYECLFSFDGNVQIIRWDGGLNLGMMNFQDITRLQSNFVKSPFKSGDVVRASISGSNISVFINNTLVATASDTRYATGDPGIGFFTRPNGNSANFAMDSYNVTAN